MVPQAEQEHSQRVQLRFAECREEVCTSRNSKCAHVVRHADEIEHGWHNTAEDHDLNRQITIYSPKQTVESQHQENQPHTSDQVTYNACPEERLVRRDIVDRRRSVSFHEQLARYVYQSKRPCEHY